MSLVSFIIIDGSWFGDGGGITLTPTQVGMLSAKMRSGEENIIATITNPGSAPFTVTIRNPSGINDPWRLGHPDLTYGNDVNNYNIGLGWGVDIPDIVTGALFECAVQSLFWNTIKNTREE
jgi:hypothetical protein